MQQTLTEIFAALQKATGLSYWEIAKNIAEKRGKDVNNYGSAVKNAIANMDKASFSMVRDCFEACGVDIVAAIAIASHSSSNK